jgi:hypothetical protein
MLNAITPLREWELFSEINLLRLYNRLTSKVQLNDKEVIEDLTMEGERGRIINSCFVFSTERRRKNCLSPFINSLIIH